MYWKELSIYHIHTCNNYPFQLCIASKYVHIKTWVVQYKYTNNLCMVQQETLYWKKLSIYQKHIFNNYPFQLCVAANIYAHINLGHTAQIYGHTIVRESVIYLSVSVLSVSQKVQEIKISELFQSLIS